MVAPRTGGWTTDRSNAGASMTWLCSREVPQLAAGRGAQGSLRTADDTGVRVADVQLEVNDVARLRAQLVRH